MSPKALILIAAICLVLLMSATGKKDSSGKHPKDHSPKCRCPSEEDGDKGSSEEDDDEDELPECENCPKGVKEEFIPKKETCACGASKDMKKNMKKLKSGAKSKKLFSYPWVVTLHHTKNTPGPHGYCQGALISNTAIITSARCVISLKAAFSCFEKISSECFMKTSELQIGTLGKDKKKPNTLLPIKKIIPHHKYSLKTGKNDIAIVELNQSYPCTKYFHPICIPKSDFTEDGQEVGSAGWGTIDEKLKDSAVKIRVGKLKKTNPKHCAPKKVLSKKKIFCAVGDSPASCQGDNGGVVFAYQNDTAFGLGIISSSVCWNFCNPASPITHTLIPAYYDFISKHVKDLTPPVEAAGKAAPFSLSEDEE